MPADRCEDCRITVSPLRCGWRNDDHCPRYPEGPDNPDLLMTRPPRLGICTPDHAEAT